MPGVTCARCGYLMRDVVDGTRCPVCARNRRNPSPPDKPVPRARNPRPPSGPVPKPNDEGRRRSLDKILDEVTEILGGKEESVGFTLSSDKVTITQIGGTEEFTVVLDTKTSLQVYLSVASADATKVRVSPTELAFTNFNWYEPQTISVTDNSGDTDTDTDITVSVDLRRSDGAYDSVPYKTVSTITSFSKEAQEPDSEVRSSEVIPGHPVDATAKIRKLSLMVASLATGAAISRFIVYDLLSLSAQTWIHGIY